MKTLVTGGAGFIGSAFIRYLRRAYPQDRVVCLDALTYAGNLHTLDALMDDAGFTFIHGDISDGALVDDLFARERFDLVVNFAAETHVDRSIEDPGVFLRTNVLGVQVLLDAARRSGVSRFHQVSTDEVYGDLPLSRPDLRFVEDTPLHASSPYAASKAAADLLVLSYHRTYGLSVTISRCSNNYGPYQFPEKMIPLMTINALEDRQLPVYGDGLNVRDWIYVDDHCEAIDMIMRRGTPGEVYNVGGDSERANIDVVREILAVTGKDESLISYIADRKGHDRRYAIDNGKIRAALGWSPRTDFAKGLARTVRWYMDERAWWAGIVSGEYRQYYERMYGSR